MWRNPTVRWVKTSNGHLLEFTYANGDKWTPFIYRRGRVHSATTGQDVSDWGGGARRSTGP